MNGTVSGYEPNLGGDRALTYSSGNEPMLGGERMRRSMIDHLLRQLEKPQTTHLRRATIGDILNEATDTRPGVGLDEEGLPDIVWCRVPPGEIFLTNYEQPFRVDPIYIARYPITWKQYRIFLDAPDGHRHPLWWDGLQRREEYPREALLVDNLPAQEVSWYDAMAYCRWLSRKVGYAVRLPTEWEWEQAATGGDPANIFPWGWDTAAKYYANTRESMLRRPTAVGMYPLGISPVGALDMSGNVFEWCLNAFKNPSDISPGPARRSMRGGSWFQIFQWAQVFFRASDNPYYRFNATGFRLVAVDPTPGVRRVPLSAV